VQGLAAGTLAEPPPGWVWGGDPLRLHTGWQPGNVGRDLMKLPIRVLHLIKLLGRGGAEVMLGEALRCMDRERFVYVYGYFLPWKNAIAADLEAQRDLLSASILLAARRVAGHLQSWIADLLHCHLPVAGVVGRLAGRWVGVPVVYTGHNALER
jgi:L-malate glycosyltransferase